MLPSFLVQKLFALEFLRQSLFVEQEHFVKHRKGANIKLKYTVEPFLVFYFAALAIMEDIIKGMNFKEAQEVKYDPRGIINQRKSHNRCVSFDNE